MNLNKKPKHDNLNAFITQFPRAEYEKFKNALLKQLNQVINIADKCNVPIRLDCGTLLGLYRNGDLIYPDFDNDLAINIKDLSAEFLFYLYQSKLYGRRKEKQFLQYVDTIKALETGGLLIPGTIPIVNYSSKFFNNLINAKTDIFVYADYNGESQTVLGDLYMHHPSVNIYPFNKLETKFGTFNIPNNTEQYLADMYGDDWKIPNPNFKDDPSQLRGLDKRDFKIIYNTKQKTFTNER